MTPEQKIGVMFTPFELRTLIKLLEEKEEELFTTDNKAESEVYNTLAVQLESILHKALESPTEVEKVEQPLPKDEYIQSVQPLPDVINKGTDNVVDRVVVEKMEVDYIETMNMFRKILNSQYILFAKKQADYGPGNISMNGNKELALLGLGVRMNDKTQRILHITHNNKEPNNESLEDSFKDLSIYGIIAQIVLGDKWGK